MESATRHVHQDTEKIQFSIHVINVMIQIAINVMHLPRFALAAYREALVGPQKEAVLCLAQMGPFPITLHTPVKIAMKVAKPAQMQALVIV